MRSGTGRLDDIERMVAEGELDAHFPRFESPDAVPRKWDEILMRLRSQSP